MNLKRFAAVTLASMALAAPVCLVAQDQGSVAEAAKKAQAGKKNAPKAKMVIDNDNLDTLTGTINVVGEEPPAAAEQAKEGAKDGATDKTKEAPAQKATVKDESYWRQKFADANKKLADDQRELDILQREYNLKQQQFYADPNAQLKQEYTRQDLNDTKTKIDSKAADVQQDKQAIADLEDQLRQSGGSPGWEREAPAPQPQQ